MKITFFPRPNLAEGPGVRAHLVGGEGIYSIVGMAPPGLTPRGVMQVIVNGFG